MTSDDFLINCTKIQTERMGSSTDEEPKSKCCSVNWFNRNESQQNGKHKLTLHTGYIEGTSYNCYLYAYLMEVFNLKCLKVYSYLISKLGMLTNFNRD
jgi:hypothetical protein